MLKIRELPQNNYKAIFINGKTIRIALDPSTDIFELEFPEFYDIKITNKCYGKCPYCYQNSRVDDIDFENIIDKTNSFFGKLSENEKPFQVAIGGGEPTLHPDFIRLLKTFKDLDIEPNYTTNGMNLTNEIISATLQYCSGVAISCHPHLKVYWKVAVEKLTGKNVVLNFHVMISTKESVDEFISIYNEYKDKVKYFVLLPSINKGRCTNSEINYDYLKEKLQEICLDQIAFGAKFYDFLLENRWINASLYQPEAFSKYLDMSNMRIYGSSFE